MEDLRLMKGNEAIAEAAIRAGCDGYFGYPITPQSEVMEYLMKERPENRTGMVVLFSGLSFMRYSITSDCGVM